MLSLTLDGDWHSKLPEGGWRRCYPVNGIMYLSLTKPLSLQARAATSCSQHYGAVLQGLDTIGRLKMLSLPLWTLLLFSEASAPFTMQLRDNLHYKAKALPSSLPSIFLPLEAAEIDSSPSLLLFSWTAIKLSLSFAHVCS